MEGGRPHVPACSIHRWLCVPVTLPRITDPFYCLSSHPDTRPWKAVCAPGAPCCFLSHYLTVSWPGSPFCWLTSAPHTVIWVWSGSEGNSF